MTVQRPNVIVYQEFDEINVVPDTAELNALTVGPCYQLLDYLDDKEDCYAGEYGDLNAANPLVAPSSVVISNPPSIKPGGILQGDSVSIYFDEARVVITEGGSSNDTKATFSAGDNLFSAHTTSAGVHFSTAGVAAGDILITQSPGSTDYNATVKEVIDVLTPDDNSLSFLTGTTKGPVYAGDTVVITGDANSRDGIYTIHRVRDDSSLEFLNTGWTFVGTGSANLTLTITSPTGTVRTGFSAISVSLSSYSDIRTSGDFATANDTTNRYWRIERDVSDIALDSADFTISSNEITLNGAITTDLSSTLTGLDVSYAKIYIEYSALRTDLQNVQTLGSFTEIQTVLGKFDARNPLCVGAVIAKANTTTAVQAYGLKSDDLPGYLDFIDRVSTLNTIYAITPLTYDTSILAALNSMSLSLSNPSYALDNGIKQKFRSILGGVDLITTKTVITAKENGTTSAKAGTAPADKHILTFAQVGGTAPDFTALNLVPGDTVEFYDATPTPTTTTYTIAHVESSDSLKTDEVVGDLVTSTAASSFTIKRASGTDVVWTIGTAGVTDISVTGSTQDLELILTAPNADFLTNGVVPGDYLQFPSNPMLSTWTTYNSYVIDEVLSQERVRIVNQGNNTSLLNNELPHIVNRLDGSPITPGFLNFKIIRNLDKTQQVTEMAAVASSFGSLRTVLAYPNLVDVTSLVDGSKTRAVASTPETADAQPGYYLACGIGGLTAGTPSQQAFTNLGIAGISRIYNSSDYFSEEQITDLSNSGIWVYTQENASALPLCVHEVTTDVSALEFSEYMVTKNYDYVAITYLNTLLDFPGKWNVLAETIEFIRQALFSVGANLKTKYVARIGAPLTSAEIKSVAVSEVSADRIESHITVQLPMVLNTLAIHLVA